MFHCGNFLWEVFIFFLYLYAFILLIFETVSSHNSILIQSTRKTYDQHKNFSLIGKQQGYLKIALNFNMVKAQPVAEW